MYIKEMKTNKIKHKNKFDISAITSYDLFQNKSKTRSHYEQYMMLLSKVAIAMKKSPENEKFKFIFILQGCEEIKFFRNDFGCKISSQIWERAKKDNFFKDNNDFGPRKQILLEFLEL